MTAADASREAVPPAAGWRRDFLRAGLLVVISASIGLAVNAFSSKPVPLLDARGPGALIERIPRITIAELKTLLDSQAPILILDVRPDESFKRGAPTGAVHAPAHDILRDYERLHLDSMLKANDECILLCDSADCPMADHAGEILMGLGHRHLRVLQGGWLEYEKSGLPIVRPGK